MKHVAILGGGMSGLLVAHFLKKNGHRVSVFEASSRPGGWVKSSFEHGMWIEWGPNTVMANNDWLQLLSELSLDPLWPSPNSRSRFVWRDNQRMALPTGLFEFLRSPLLSKSAKWSVICDLFGSKSLGEDDLSVSDFFKRFFHQEIVDWIVDPFVGGVFAGDVTALSMKAAFPKVWKGAKTRGSVIRGLLLGERSKGGRKKLISFAQGLEMLPKALSHSLGSDLFLGNRVKRVIKRETGYLLETQYGSHQVDGVVSCLPSFEAATLFSEILSRSSIEFLNQIFYQPVLVWNTVFKKPPHFESGFGCLIPSKASKQLRGSLWSSEIFASRSDGQSLACTQYFSGEQIPDSVESQLPLLKSVLKIESNPLWSETRLNRKAIPQFGLGHVERVEEFLRTSPPHLHWAGNFLEGAGPSQVFDRAQKVASEITF